MRCEQWHDQVQAAVMMLALQMGSVRLSGTDRRERGNSGYCLHLCY
jgi:hypothetical protein